MCRAAHHISRDTCMMSHATQTHEPSHIYDCAISHTGANDVDAQRRRGLRCFSKIRIPPLAHHFPFVSAQIFELHEIVAVCRVCAISPKRGKHQTTAHFFALFGLTTLKYLQQPPQQSDKHRAWTYRGSVTTVDETRHTIE